MARTGHLATSFCRIEPLWFIHINLKGLYLSKHDADLNDICNGIHEETMLGMVSLECISNGPESLEQPVDGLVSAANHSHIMSLFKGPCIVWL